MSTDKRPSREAPVERPADSVRPGSKQSDRTENSITYRENVDRVNRSRDTEIERALSAIRR
jgi:hypothetical protein